MGPKKAKEKVQDQDDATDAAPSAKRKRAPARSRRATRRKTTAATARASTPESEEEPDLGPDTHPFCCNKIELCIGERMTRFYKKIGKDVKELGGNYEDGPFSKICCFAAWSLSVLPHKIVAKPAVLEEPEFIIEFRPYTTDSVTPTRSTSRWFIPSGVKQDQFNELVGNFNVGGFSKAAADTEVWFKCPEFEHEDLRFCLTYWVKMLVAG